jgi:predicted dehydrogenase
MHKHNLPHVQSTEPDSIPAHTQETRRRFLARTSASALSFTLLQPRLARGADANSQIEVGLIGAGGRGRWIADLFAKHGGYRVVGVADYFQDRIDQVGEKHQIPAARRYPGLYGYRRLLEQPLDAVILQSPPYFHPPQAAEAVAARKHIYMAKPVAVDVPGCQSIAESGRLATAAKLCFLVDFQTRAMTAYREAIQRVHAGMIGRIACGEATYHCGNTFDGPNEQLKKDPTNAELRLRAWGLDRVLSGDVITEQNIHALDVAAWILNAEPVRAYGTGGAKRGFAGTCWDHFAVVFYYPNDVLLSFNSKQLGHGYDDICCRIYGNLGTIDTHYGGNVTVRSQDDAYNGGSTRNIYQDGAVNNIAAFHQAISRGDYSNATVPSSVRSNLTTILGRTAAYQRREVTWDEMIRANEKWEADLKGLKS